MTTTFLVTWEIEIEADTHEEAAREALKIQRDPKSIAHVFYVRDLEAPWDDPETIDLDNPDAVLPYPLP